MSLKSIVRALGGDLYAGGRRANIPAPGHSRRDRSVSLLERDGRLIIHTFGDGVWRPVPEDLPARGLLAEGADGPAASSPRLGGDEDRTRRREVAQALWASGRKIAGTLSERHCRLRGLVGDPPGPTALRHHGLAPLSVYRPGPATRPALLAGVCDPDGVVTAIEITYLRADGHRASALRLARKTVGAVAPGSAVRLDVAAETLLVAEGVFTALSARRRFCLPAWALLSTSNLRAWRPPPGVRRVVIAADRGRDGEASAAALARALRALGVSTRIVLPPPGFGDWNELDAAEARGPVGGQRRK